MSAIDANVLQEVRGQLALRGRNNDGQGLMDLLIACGVNSHFFLYAQQAGGDIGELIQGMRRHDKLSMGRRGGAQCPYNGGSYKDLSDTEFAALRPLLGLRCEKLKTADILRDCLVPRDHAEWFLDRLVNDPTELPQERDQLRNELERSDRFRKAVLDKTIVPSFLWPLVQLYWCIHGFLEGFAAIGDAGIVPVFDRLRSLAICGSIALGGYFAFRSSNILFLPGCILFVMFFLNANWRQRAHQEGYELIQDPLLPHDPEYWSGRICRGTDPPELAIMRSYWATGHMAFYAVAVLVVLYVLQFK